MPLNLMYITNNPDVAKIAEENGVDWIFVDLEIIGKEERQPNMDSVKSYHTISDVIQLRSLISKSKLLVRVNSIHDGSPIEIEQVIAAGADIVMLPYFKTLNEIQIFINLVNARAKICLLLETFESLKILDDILELKNIDFIHIGLNDLHIDMKRTFMFELLSDGTVENIIRKIKKYNIPYGFGGIARLGGGLLPAECILAEHYRLKSSMVILSRSFLKADDYHDYQELREVFSKRINEIRSYERMLDNQDSSFFSENKEKVDNIVYDFINRGDIENV